MIKLNKKEIESIRLEEISDNLYERTFDYLSENDLIPYGIASAKSGDPYEFVLNYLTNEINVLNYLTNKIKGL